MCAMYLSYIALLVKKFLCKEFSSFVRDEFFLTTKFSQIMIIACISIIWLANCRLISSAIANVFVLHTFDLHMYILLPWAITTLQILDVPILLPMPALIELLN